MGSQDTDKVALEATLQQRYIELLEKRISQLEVAVNNPPKSEADKSKEEKDKKAEEDKKKEDETKTSRYVNALREWDKTSASYKDEIVAESSLKKDRPKGIAYIFRRVVHDTYSGEKRAYSEVEIEDPGLIQLLKADIDNKYPGVNFDGNRIYMQAPFPAIIHNWDKLKATAAKDPESQACKDLAQLLERITTSEELEDYFRTREANIVGKMTTFETMWTVFAPKTLVVIKPFMGIPQLLQVSSAPILWSWAPAKNISALYLWAWLWDWNGRKMVKVHFSLKIKRFRGTKLINELDFVPLSYYDGAADLRDTIQKRALNFLRATLFSKGENGQQEYKNFKYEGNAYVARRKLVTGKRQDDEDEEENKDNKDDEESSKAKLIPIEGEIIVDAQAYLQYANSTRIHALGEMENDDVEEAMTEIEDAFSNMKLEDIENGKYDNNDDLLIVPGRLLGYATKEKMWGQFYVDWTMPPAGKQPHKFHNDLQLEPKYKRLIESLVASHEERNERQVKDVVSDKGKGLVLLFHGPPGVGKTLTAETIAEATGKPLFVVSVAEIGLDASRAEKNLEKLFHLATKWEAILLVDEADVFLETRGSTSDASRNALVSVLLRVLEYYKGIIILTTNRITSIDIAVISRIHLAIRYTDLDDRQMKSIFKYFLDQLEPELIHDRGTIDKFIDHTGHIYGLNGRQIRNVVSAALASARHGKQQSLGDGRLTEDHLRNVCEMTRAFQEQLKDYTMPQRASNEAGGYGGHRRY